MPVDEKLRRTDPSGKLDAIVVERGTDATVATPTQVFVAPKGQAIQPDTKAEPVLRADHVKKAEVVWASSGRLKIELQGGRIFRHLPLDHPSAASSKSVPIRSRKSLTRYLRTRTEFYSSEVCGQESHQVVYQEGPASRAVDRSPRQR